MARRDRWTPVPPSYLDRPSSEELRRFVASLEPAKLVELVVAHAEGDDGFRRALELEMAAQAASPAVARLRQMIADAFAVRSFVELRDAAAFVRDLYPIHNTLTRLLEEGEAGAVIELAESALAEGDSFLDRIDDSDAHLRMFLEDLEALHLRACQTARPDPVALAHRLFDAETQSGFGLFSDSYVTYSEVLGPEGRATFRQRVEEIWALLPALGPGDGDGPLSSSRSQITHMMKVIAKTSGDFDALVRVLSRDLSSADDFLRIADAYRSADRQDEALEWAEKGVEAFPNRTDAHLRASLADLYHARERHAEAMELVWANFVDRPRFSGYCALQNHAERGATGIDWRQKALDLLTPLAHQDRVRGGSAFPEARFDDGPAATLIRIHLHEAESDAAWETARTLGCSRGLWLELAKARETEHPDDALAIFRQHANQALETAHERNHEEAVERLKDMRRVLERTGRTGELVDYVTALRTEYKRRPNFLKKLDLAKLP